MIPSDQFVRFYNEVFKYVDSRGPGELRKYYDRVAANQEYHCMELFSREKLQGMYKYWEHIRIEENCDMAHEVEDGCYHFEFFSCPSLSKALDNDAGACPKYCNHCPGWILPLIRKAGCFAVYNLIDRKLPRCEMFVYLTRERAEKKAEELAAEYGDDVILTSFERGER